MSTDELLNHYNKLQTELLIDMDMSGGLYLEYQNTLKK